MPSLIDALLSREPKGAEPTVITSLWDDGGEAERRRALPAWVWVPRTFGREDVEALKRAALLLEDLKYFRSGNPDVLRSVARRIEALLPEVERR